VGLQQYETPYAVRFTHLIDVINWNCAAVYSSDWKDALTKNDVLLHAPPTIAGVAELNIVGGVAELKVDVNLHTSDTRLMCMASSWAVVVQDWVPEASQAVMGYLQAFQYPGITDGGYDSRVMACFVENGVEDTVCLTDFAEEECYTPLVMGAIVAQQVSEYARRDGEYFDRVIGRLTQPLNIYSNN